MDDERDGLGEVLRRATDRVEGRGMAGAALAGARRARRRRGVLAVGAVAASVLVVLGGVRLAGSGTLGTEPDPAAPTPTASPTSTGVPSPPAPPPDPVVHPTWDPFTVVDAPLRDTVLPERLVPPAEAPAIEDDPVPAAVVAWPAKGRDVMLLGEDGRWRSVPGTADALSGTFGDVVEPVLGHGGQKVAMSTDAGILVVEVATGARRTIPWPDPVAPPWDTAPELRWAPLGNAAGLAVLHWNETWLVELDGTARKAPYSRPYGTGLAFEPVGPVVEKRWEELDLRVWDGAPHAARITSTVPFGYWGERLVFERGLMALTGGGNGLPGDAGPMVVEAATGAVLGYAPIRDRDSVYGDNGRLTALGFLDEQTVLLLVGPMDFRTMELGDESWHLVAWDFRDGGFERLTTGGTGMHAIAVASGVLASDW
ncbi:hypothetical protein [Nocardioides solisilvae]|uniref:hypothetical protein n=1 Tax=Nocardioides solisilvae TaxID=1542435 RepID=UPI000D7507D0|nr:hypothetical protein [Nocardioides solisilvae]